jgi:hypothetical protein
VGPLPRYKLLYDCCNDKYEDYIRKDPYGLNYDNLLIMDYPTTDSQILEMIKFTRHWLDSKYHTFDEKDDSQTYWDCCYEDQFDTLNLKLQVLDDLKKIVRHI